MASTLQVVDVDTESTVLFDLNDPTGANSALYGGISTRLVADVDFGAPVLSNQEAGAETPRSVAFNRLARRRMRFRVIMLGTSFDNLRRAVATLSRYLADGACFRWIADGSTDRLFIDADPSTAPALLAGQEASLIEATRFFQTNEGVEIELSTLPYLRGDGLAPTLNRLQNPTALIDTNDDGTPNSWTKTASGTPTVASATDSLHFVAGGAAQGLFQGTPAASAAVGQVWTVSAEVQVASGTVALILDWRTAADATISSVTTTQGVGGWVRIAATGTAPATTDHVRFRIESSGAASTFDFRNAQAEQSSSASLFRVAAETLGSDPASTTLPLLIPVYNPGTAPAPCILDVALPDANTAGVEMDYARLSNEGVMGRNRLADFLNGPNYLQGETTAEGWSWAVGTDSSSVADASSGVGLGASGGNVLRVTHATDPTTSKVRATWTRSTRMDCLRGRWVVIARCKAAAARLYHLQLVWGPGSSPQYSNDEVDHDATLPASYVYVPVNLGEIEFPEELSVALGTITLQLWTRLDSGTAANLDVDALWLIPATDTAAATLPDGSTQTVNGAALGTPKDLGAADPTWTAPTYAGYAPSCNLGVANQGAGWGDNTNGAFQGVGHHVVVFSWNFPIGVGTFTYKVEVANLTDNVVVTSQTYTGPATPAHFTLQQEFDGVAGKAYQPRVVCTVGASLSVVVESITHSVAPTVTQNQRVRTDAGSLPTRNDVEALDSSGNLLFEMTPTQVPFWVPPGLSLVWVNELDAAPQGYVENAATNGRTFTVSPTVYRREFT